MHTDHVTIRRPRRAARLRSACWVIGCVIVLIGATAMRGASGANTAGGASAPLEVTSTPARNGAMLGYSDAQAQREREIEQHFDAQLNGADQRDWLKTMASQPNQVGSPHDKANAEFMLQLLRGWGWDTHLETFQVLYPTPKRVALQMIAPHPFTAKLHEPAISGDATSGAPGELPPYNAYSADGDVTAELVYVNHGMPEDYLALERRGISVQGRIVIVRYGGGWRGLKPKLAHEHGAIGCLIYSDPADDGYAEGDVYPRGAWRPADGVQRGSVEDITLFPGDPLTPGVGATEGAQRLSIAAAPTLMKIPVLPISYGDARPLLAALAGPVAPQSWRGALPITYHIGPGPARVRLQVQSDWSLKPIYDVIARIPGSELPDEWVVRGNHHDGWVFGAWDPLAGNVALLDEAKAIGALLKTGWRPRRTLIYASWDGEEPGLLGSTEWAETHAAELTHHAVMYVNTDTIARGFFGAGGSHSLQRLVNEIAEGVEDPETHVSVETRLRARLRVQAYGGGDARAKELAQAATSGTDLPLEPLGSGSDYSSFLQHLGIATLDLSYSGEGEDEGIYHSAYDSFDHYVRFGDPGFAYGVATAQTAGHLMLRMADADVLPLQFSDAYEVYHGYVQELHELLDSKRAQGALLASLRQAHAFVLSSDPTRPVGPPASELEVPFVDFAPLDNAMLHLQRAARGYDHAYAAAAAGGLMLSDARRAQLDGILQGLEQDLTSENGLPGRPWYKHLMYAPGMYTGYGAKTIPGVREAIEQGDYHQAEQYVAITAQALERYCGQLEAATALLGPAEDAR
jgi:N-acetylated-alpha-linked acidic dipeptidase